VEAFEEVSAICASLESHFRDMQDIEFTIDHGRPYILQTRAAKRTARAAVRIAVDMVKPRPVFLPWMNPELSDVVLKEVNDNWLNIQSGNCTRLVNIKRKE